MLLRSYGFAEEIGGDIWNLFKNVNKLPAGMDYHVLEIIRSAQTGDIDAKKYAEDDKDFDIVSYVKKIEKNQRQEYSRNKKREKVLLDDVDADEEGVVAPTVPFADPYESIDNADELEEAVRWIHDNAMWMLVECRIDIYLCMRQALKGIPESIQALRRVSEEYELVGEKIYAVLSSGYSFEELFGKGVCLKL